MNNASGIRFLHILLIPSFICLHWKLHVALCIVDIPAITPSSGLHLWGTFLPSGKQMRPSQACKGTSSHPPYTHGLMANEPIQLSIACSFDLCPPSFLYRTLGGLRPFHILCHPWHSSLFFSSSPDPRSWSNHPWRINMHPLAHNPINTYMWLLTLPYEQFWFLNCLGIKQPLIKKQKEVSERYYSG